MAINRWLVIVIISVVLAIGLIVVVMNIERQPIEEDEFDERYLPAIRIVVHNGTGFRRLANEVRQSMFGKNIDVVGVGNTRNFNYDETIIVVKHDDETELRRLMRMTGVRNVIYAVNENFHVPFILIVGRDYHLFFDIERN